MLSIRDSGWSTEVVRSGDTSSHVANSQHHHANDIRDFAWRAATQACILRDIHRIPEFERLSGSMCQCGCMGLHYSPTGPRPVS